MRILISNDDGILAPGLSALAAAAADLGEIHVVAPQNPQSAAGHAITLTQPLTVKQVTIDGPGGFTGMSVDGRPADCVRLAIRNLIKGPIDLVLSGINAGNNVGINVFYSGTVAAAAEGTMFGIPAIAFSASIAGGGPDFPNAAKYCRWVLERLLAQGLHKSDLISVNIPTLVDGTARGVRVAAQSTAEIEDVYNSGVDEKGHQTYRIADAYDFRPGRLDTDVVALNEGYITITPLHIDRTNRVRLRSLSRRTWELPEE